MSALGAQRRSLVLLVGAACLLSGCWKSVSTVTMRDGREWTEERVVARATTTRIEVEAAEDDDGWEARLGVEIADTCAVDRLVEVQEVELINRKVDGKTVGIPLLTGIVVAIGTPLVANTMAQNGDPIFNQPVAPRDILIGVAVGEGTAGALIGAGIGAIDVSRKGAGNHEKVLDRREERRGEVGARAPCRWRALPEGTLVLRPDRGEDVRAGVTQGVARVPLPPPSATAPLAWTIELQGVAGGVELDLSRGDYADRSHLARVEDDLGAGRLESAVANLEHVRGKARGREELGEELTRAIEAKVSADLGDGRALEALALLDRAKELRPGGDELRSRALVATTEYHLGRGDVAGAVATAGRLEPRGEPAGRMRGRIEGAFGDLVTDGRFDDAAAAARLAEPLMGEEWSLGASERAETARVLRSVAAALVGEGPDGESIEVPSALISALAEVRDRMLGKRQGREPVYPEGVTSPVQALADASAALVGRKGFEARFPVSTQVAADPDGAWLDAAETFVERFAEHPTAPQLASQLGAAREARDKARALQNDFDAFSESFARAAAQNFLASRSGKVEPISPGRSACSRGKDFLRTHGVPTYRRMAATFCKGRFPSNWVYAEGRRGEVRADVPVRACDAFFKAPRGCD